MANSITFLRRVVTAHRAVPDVAVADLVEIVRAADDTEHAWAGPHAELTADRAESDPGGWG